MANRALLSINVLEEFEKWLKEEEGYSIWDPKGNYEALRAKKGDKWLIVFYKPGAKEHLSVRDEDVKIVRKFINERNTMKAYVIQDRGNYCEYSLVVFAKTRGQAISYALGTEEFPQCDWDFTQLKATRCPALDKAYRGRTCMDYDDPADRLAMVRDAGFRCNDDAFDPDDCEQCAGKEYCSRYEEYLDEKSEEDL